MAQKSQPLMLATYNIRLGIQEGIEAVVDIIKSEGIPDVIAVQEVGKNWIMGPEGDTTAEIAELLDLPHFFHVPTVEDRHRDKSKALYGHALLSRWPFTTQEVIELPQFDDEPRAMLFSRIDSPAGSLEIISTHLSHRSSDRPYQGKFLLDWLADHPRRSDARFLMGDLNAAPTEEWISPLLTSWNDADSDENRSTFPADDPRRRIDYILGEGARCLDAQVLPATTASDHRPLFTTWSLDH